MIDSGKELSLPLVVFLHRHICSLRQLEALLLFFTEPNRDWTVETVTRAISGNEGSTSKWLKGFVESGFLELSPSASTFRYKPGGAEREALLAELIQQYRMRPLKIIDVIMNEPSQKMLSFLEAFKIKKEDPYGAG
jgi:hypothetical protein